MPAKSVKPSQHQLIEACVQDLRRIVRALETYSRTVEKRFGLTGPQLWALWELDREGPMSLKELATRMHLDPSTVVGVIDRLLVKGMVHRDQDPDDRRRISLNPTEKGRRILGVSPHPAQGHLLAGLEGMNRTRVEILQKSLRSLVVAMGADRLDAPFFFSD